MQIVGSNLRQKLIVVPQDASLGPALLPKAGLPVEPLNDFWIDDTFVQIRALNFRQRIRSQYTLYILQLRTH